MTNKTDHKMEKFLKAVKPQANQKFLNDLEQKILRLHSEQGAKKEKAVHNPFTLIRRLSFVLAPLVVVIVVLNVFPSTYEMGSSEEGGSGAIEMAEFEDLDVEIGAVVDLDATESIGIRTNSLPSVGEGSFQPSIKPPASLERILEAKPEVSSFIKNILNFLIKISS